MRKDSVRKVGILVAVLGVFGLAYFTGFTNILLDQAQDQTSALSAYSPLSSYPLSVKSPQQKISEDLQERIDEVGKYEDIPVVVELTAPTSMAVGQQTATLSALQAQGFNLQARNTRVSNTLVGTAKTNNIEGIAQNPNVDQVLYDGYYFDTTDINTNARRVSLLDSSKTQINVSAAWDEGYRGQGVKVIIIDSGIQNNHPALTRGGSSLVLKEKSFIGFEADYTTEHGTHCAGVIASQDSEYKGVAPNVKGFVDYVAFTGAGARLSWILSALDEAYREAKVSREPVVVSNSWGGPPVDSPEMNKVREAVIKLTEEAVVVFAAGNAGPGSGTISAPGDADSGGKEVITVGAVDDENDIAEFSSRGPDKWGTDNQEPDVVAPGVQITSAVPGGFDDLSGTSMATPHVSGLVALMLSKNNDYSNREVLDILEQSSKDLGANGFDYKYGYGIVQAGRALEASPNPPVYGLALNDMVFTGLSVIVLVVGAVFAVDPSLKRYLEGL